MPVLGCDLSRLYLYMDDPEVTGYQGSPHYLQHTIVGIVCDVVILRKSLHVSLLSETLKFDRVSHGLTGFFGGKNVLDA